MSASAQKSRFAETAVSIPHLLTRSDVAAYLGVDLRTVTWWVWALKEKRRYYEFTIDRRSGTEPRTIRAPIKPIKDFQRALLPMLEAGYAPRTHVHGFVRGKSAVTNAAVHRRQRWILRIDLKDFFPSIHFGRVMGIFRAAPFDFPYDVATLLTQICCHRRELPQGAPTSPILSNLVCRTLDRELGAIARALHCHYSRYADDICFSCGRRDFPVDLATKSDGPVRLGSSLRHVIAKNDFVIHDSKTRLMPRRQRQRVTGIIVNERLNVPREYARHLRAVLHIWSRYGEKDAEAAFVRAGIHRNWPSGKPPADFRLVVRGQLQHLGQVRGYDRIYQQLATLLAQCDSSFTPTAPMVPEAGDVVYATERPSDPFHIDAALRAMRAGKDFTDLRLLHVAHKPPKNDTQLWKWLEEQAGMPNQLPHVGLFDADTRYAARIGPSGWKHLGNAVVAVVIAAAPWTTDERFCIEMLYPQEVLRRENADGRRIFLRSEFDEAGTSEDGTLRMAYPKRKTLVVEKVHPTAGPSRSLALDKVAFSEAVFAGRPPYQMVDFSGFRPTLERIWLAVASAQRWCA
jgi:RNA-directed DNA polymerase